MLKRIKLFDVIYCIRPIEAIPITTECVVVDFTSGMSIVALEYQIQGKTEVEFIPVSRIKTYFGTKQDIRLEKLKKINGITN